MKIIGSILRGIGTAIWRFMVLFSFIVNLVLVGVILVLGLILFNIKNDVLEPLLVGLHSSFVGLNEATIDWTIPVRDSVDAEFILPLETETIVVLTEDVPVEVSAFINLNNSNVPVNVDLVLPTGLQLPVFLDLDVPVDEVIPVELDVRAVIPLAETQLADPFNNLIFVFEPIMRALGNLPSDRTEIPQFVQVVRNGTVLDELFQPTDYTDNAWPGFSRTAGLGYDLLPQNRDLNAVGDATTLGAQTATGGPEVEAPNVVTTGIQPQGGIPALDRFVRPELYANDRTPDDVNNQAANQTSAVGGVPEEVFRGNFDEYNPPAPTATPFAVPAQSATGDSDADLGIIIEGE